MADDRNVKGKGGNGVLYAGIGIGSAAAVGLVGYGACQILSTSTCGPGTACNASMQTCQNELSSLVNKYLSLYNQFVTEDAAQNVPISPGQQDLLNENLNQQNLVMQNCVAAVSKAYNLNFVAASISEIAAAIAIGITLLFGAKALSYIRSKGYFKKPPQTPGGGMGALQDGTIDYLKAVGKAPAEWSAGSSTVKSETATLTQDVQAYTTTLASINIVTEEIAAAMLAADTAVLLDDELLVLAILA